MTPRLRDSDAHDALAARRSAPRSPARLLRELGAEPVVCDVFDRAAVLRAVAAFGPDVVFHQLTDLPDEVAELGLFRRRNARMRGQFYGPGTFYETASPEPPRIHVDAAARRTLPALAVPPGVTLVVDDRAT